MTPLARFSVLLSLALPMTLPQGARAQAAGEKLGAATGPQDHPSPPEAQPGDEIVVTARRYGEARVAAETEFGEDEIASHGADSIQDLLARLTPFIGNGGGDDEPVLLINGRPADGDRSILSYPAEALNRLAVLKPDAAAQYGYPPGRRVVNLVLKQHFASLNLDAGMTAATAGGQYGGDLSAGRVTIDGPTRWNVQARISRDSALRKSARSLPAAAGIFDGTGYVTAPGGGEIDPALSLLAGRPVSLAAIPPGAASQAPTLADFAATADRTHPVDPDAYETLLPSKRSILLSAGVTRPLGTFSASLNLNATSIESNGLRGLPMASIAIPAGSPWSPFGSDVLLVRPLAGERALRNDNSAQTLATSLTLTGRIADWQVTLSGGYGRNWTDSLLERGIDTRRVQQLVAAGDPAFNPYVPWGRQFLLAGRNRAHGDNLSARLNVIKTAIDLPAGPLTANVSINASRNSLESRNGDLSGNPVVTDRASSRIDGQISLNVPLSRRGKEGAGPLGDLALTLLAGGQSLSGGSLQKRFGAGLTWTPHPVLQLRGTLEDVEAAPSPEQLDGPVVTTINRIYDYARQEAVDAIWILGGNPNLGRGRRQSRALTAMVRPLEDQTLTLNFGYSEQVAKGGVAPFPELTPAIEAAFPERVTRDAAGHLVSVDARAINLARDTSAELTSGIALLLPRRGKARPAGASADPVRWSISLNYRRRLKSELLTRAGIPPIDQLGPDSGQSRDFVSLQATAGKRGIGATLNGNWSGSARLRNAGPGGAYRFAPSSILNLSLFVEPEHILPGAAKTPWLKNVKLSLDIRNLFDGYRRATLDDGSIPAGYTRHQIDPLGRTVRLSIRKRF
ncbi:hypothetical protein CAP40_19780 [Sphingomonas sp. IBVSS2]|uniref:TonB-dependent receptor n=1 Tax=Sphingomonas sp. IBVSS2 TaxID=1985172 RepID=UPI000A2DE019|nr:TonB-dependent receptor [Sphingomonas sp. IBVSS2]OSZ62448.1 hypothetical protein CAP40_19780 [Sphingomonas sp. IBVSS2]